MMERKATSIKIDPELWNKVRIRCSKKGEDVSDYLERLMIKDLITLQN